MPRVAKDNHDEPEHDHKELIERFLKSGHYTPFDRAVKQEAKARSIVPDGKRAQMPETETPKTQRALPIPNYDELTPEEILDKLAFLSRAQVRTLLAQEKKHRRRSQLVRAMEERLKGSVPLKAH